MSARASPTSHTRAGRRTEPRTRKTRRQVALRWFVIGVVVAGLTTAAYLLPIDEWLDSIARKLEDAGLFGTIAFAGIYVLASLLLVPASILTIATGAIFGLVEGLLITTVAATVVSIVAFFIARYVARGLVERLGRRHRAFAAFDRAIADGGWKVVALLRLSPAVPFSIANYLFGITAIKFWPYVVASTLATIPGTFLFVYLGHAGKQGLAALGKGVTQSPWQWGALLAGLVATAALVIYVSRLARHRLRGKKKKGTRTSARRGHEAKAHAA